MTSRIEKNRKHLATILTLVVAGFIYMIFERLGLLSDFQFLVCSTVGGALLFLRTLVVESGFRRKTTALESKLDDSATKAVEKNLGVIVEK